MTPDQLEEIGDSIKMFNNIKISKSIIHRRLNSIADIFEVWNHGDEIKHKFVSHSIELIEKAKIKEFKQYFEHLLLFIESYRALSILKSKKII